MWLYPILYMYIIACYVTVAHSIITYISSESKNPWFANISSCNGSTIKSRLSSIISNLMMVTCYLVSSYVFEMPYVLLLFLNLLCVLLVKEPQ